VKNSAKAIAALLTTVERVQGHPEFSSLYKLTQQITDCLRRIQHPIHKDDRYAGYMMVVLAFALLSITPWTDPEDLGDFFVVPISAITDTQQKSEEHQWLASKDLRDNFTNLKTALKSLFEQIFDNSTIPQE